MQANMLEPRPIDEQVLETAQIHQVGDMTPMQPVEMGLQEPLSQPYGFTAPGDMGDNFLGGQPAPLIDVEGLLEQQPRMNQ